MYDNNSIMTVQIMHQCVDAARKKVAVHCRAGLGRTGLAIACYLVFSGTYSASGAILEVRNGRLGALQTRAQELFVLVFEKFIYHLRLCIPMDHTTSTASALGLWDVQLRVRKVHHIRSRIKNFQPLPPATLDEMIQRQNLIMSGRMVQHYWNVPQLLLNVLMVGNPLHICSSGNSVGVRD